MYYRKFDIHWHDGGPSIAMMYHLRRVSDLLCNWKSCLLCYMKDVVLHCSIFFKWNKLVRVRVRVSWPSWLWPSVCSLQTWYSGFYVSFPPMGFWGYPASIWSGPWGRKTSTDWRSWSKGHSSFLWWQRGQLLFCKGSLPNSPPPSIGNK